MLLSLSLCDDDIDAGTIQGLNYVLSVREHGSYSPRVHRDSQAGRDREEGDRERAFVFCTHIDATAAGGLAR